MIVSKSDLRRGFLSAGQVKTSQLEEAAAETQVYFSLSKASSGTKTAFTLIKIKKYF